MGKKERGLEIAKQSNVSSFLQTILLIFFLLSGKMLFVRIVENSKIDAYFRIG